MEIVKQRRQASHRNSTATQILFSAVSKEGVRGLYRGFGSTVLRDIPFSIIEFPIWEWLKKSYRNRIKRELNAVEVALCGALAGKKMSILDGLVDFCFLIKEPENHRISYVCHRRIKYHYLTNVSKIEINFTVRI